MIKIDVSSNMTFRYIQRVKHHTCEKDYILNPATGSSENEKHLTSTTENSLITWNEIIGVKTKTVGKSFNGKNVICKTKNIYILLAFLLIIIVLLILVGTYCYLIKYKSKQIYLLPCYITNNKLKKFCVNNIFQKWRVTIN